MVLNPQIHLEPGRVISIWYGDGTTAALFVGMGRDGRRLRVRRRQYAYPSAWWGSVELIEPVHVAVVWPTHHQGTP